MVRLRSVALGLVLVLAASCATGKSVGRAKDAADRGDWDTAVAYYRQALQSDPDDVELRVALERASRRASAQHLERARELEMQDQMAGAIAEYKQAADLDRGNTMAVTKAVELERRMRDVDFGHNTQPEGNMTFRTLIPLGDYHWAKEMPCADGQMGSIVKLYREWKLSGDTEWLRGLWPHAKRAIEFVWKRWDKDKDGSLDANELKAMHAIMDNANTKKGAEGSCGGDKADKKKGAEGSCGGSI